MQKAKPDEAAAFAGWAQNPNAPTDQRLAAGAAALNYYVDQQDQLQELLEYLESRNPRDEDGTSELGYYEAMYEGPAYGDAASRLRAILGGE